MSSTLLKVLDHGPILTAVITCPLKRHLDGCYFNTVIHKLIYLSLRPICILCLLIWVGRGALASSKLEQSSIPQDVISLILMHQPYMSTVFLTTNYNLAFIRSNFPAAKINQSNASYKKEKSNNETIWILNKKEEVTQVRFKFDLSKWKGSSVEEKLFKQFESQISPEAFSRVPSDTRIITVKDPKNKFEFDVYFPVSDYESPVIRSVSVKTKLGDK